MSETDPDVERVYGALLARAGEGPKPERRLDATARAVELLGDPHRAYPIVHVTGTNGKTSTSRIIESLLRATGLKTGLFTSPHLISVTERIQLDGAPIEPERLAAVWDDIAPILDLVDAELAADGRAPLTYFEALTVLGFAAFADLPVDVAVIEVGMGGTWDSTNVGDGQVAVITPISLDHTALLGRTEAEIAATKAGIIKPGATVVTARQSPEALIAIQQAAEAAGAEVKVEDVDFLVTSTTAAVGGEVVAVAGLGGAYEEAFLPIFGEHQAHNAAVAVAAVEAFLGGAKLDEDLVAEGFATATSPGRLQVVGADPLVVIDAAHNPGGAVALANAFGQHFDFDEVALVIGMVADKDVEGVVGTIGPLATRILVTESGSERSIAHTDLADRVSALLPDASVTDEPSLLDAMADAREWAASQPGRAVLVTGSILLIGDVLELSQKEGWRD